MNSQTPENATNLCKIDPNVYRNCGIWKTACYQRILIVHISCELFIHTVKEI